jgi:hypothetical protein
MSVNRKVTVPVGGLLTLSSHPLSPQETTIAAWGTPDPLFTEVPRR